MLSIIQMSDKKAISAGILGVGSYVPDRVLKNDDLEKMVDTSDEWISTRTGIKQRRIALPEQAASDIAIPAAKKALDAAKVLPKAIDLIIVATSTPDMHFPATACILQYKLKCTKAAAFDLSAACSGFIYALIVAQQFVNTGTAKYVLVVASEVLSKAVNWGDRETCVLFGDGAGAVVVGPVDKGYGILSAHLAAEGAGWDLLTLPGAGSRIPLTVESVRNGKHFISMNGKEVFKFAAKVMEEGSLKTLELAGLSKEDISLLIPHQANIRIIEHAAKKLGLPMEKVMVNIHKYGNTSASSIILAMDEALEQGLINTGDNILTIAFGAGLTWGAAVIRWV